MFSLVDASGTLALRLPKEALAGFLSPKAPAQRAATPSGGTGDNNAV